MADGKQPVDDTGPTLTAVRSDAPPLPAQVGAELAEAEPAERYQLRDELQNNNLAAFGEILHENWMLKKGMSAGVSTTHIDDWYAAGRAAGAVGGKILGAGAGGFLMLYAPREFHERIKSALGMLRPVAMGFEPLGSRIIFYH